MSSCELSSGASGASDTRGFRPRFFGTVLEGEAGLALSGPGVNSCVGSMDSVTRGRRLVVGFGVTFSSAAAAFRARPLPLPCFSGAGAGVNSSSSCFNSGVGVLFSSSSELSMTGALRRVAAARVDFRGDSEAIVAVFGRLVGVRGIVAGCLLVSPSHVVSAA